MRRILVLLLAVLSLNVSGAQAAPMHMLTSTDPLTSGHTPSVMNPATRTLCPPDCLGIIGDGGNASDILRSFTPPHPLITRPPRRAYILASVPLQITYSPNPNRQALQILIIILITLSWLAMAASEMGHAPFRALRHTRFPLRSSR